jgi:hypothetical protein
MTLGIRPNKPIQHVILINLFKFLTELTRILYLDIFLYGTMTKYHVLQSNVLAREKNTIFDVSANNNFCGNPKK